MLETVLRKFGLEQIYEAGVMQRILYLSEENEWFYFKEEYEIINSKLLTGMGNSKCGLWWDTYS